MSKYLLPAILVLLSVSCAKSLELTEFDKELWESGRNGCSSERVEQLDYLKKNNDLFIGVGEASIKEYLGRPDRRELVARMGRKYYYYITPSENCKVDGRKKAPALIIEFEQRGIVKMIIVPSKRAVVDR